MKVLVAITLLSSCLFSCSTTKPLPRDIKKARNFLEVRDRVFRGQPDVSLFEQMGPMSASMKRDYKVRLSSKKTIMTDFIRSNHKQKAPLLIFSHGNKSFKETHRNQAILAATWGFHALVVQLPNTKKWHANGNILYDLSKLVHVWPEILDKNIDTSKIILVGHSFGGSAISIAAGRGAPVSGLIYLDPALLSDKIKQYVQQITVPAVLLGADPKVFKSKKRKQFFRNKSGNILEVSFKGTTHDDAQYPSRMELKAFGMDPFTSENNQKLFASAIVASAFSIANLGNTDFAYNAMQDKIRKGIVINPKLKR